MIKLYSTKSFGINIVLLTYRGITIIMSYHPALLEQELTEQISKCHDILTSKDKAKSSQSIASTIVSTMNEEKDKERR